ncbi:MAG: HD domain-containing protein [Phycisphaerales bacterium]|nr:HD domain-containing protein [Phycisphaerales bacterium]
MTAGDNVRVLLVHHDASRCVRVAGALRDRGWMCVACTEVTDAERALRRQTFDVLVLDAARPGDDGCPAFQGLSTGGDVPRIALISDEVDPRLVRSAIRHGVCGFVSTSDVDGLRTAILAAVGAAPGDEIPRCAVAAPRPDATVAVAIATDGSSARFAPSGAPAPTTNPEAADSAGPPRMPQAFPTPRQLERASPGEVARWIHDSRRQVKRGYVESVLTLVEAVEAKEPGALGHARHVSRYSEMIARRLSFSSLRIEAVRTAALLHDVGKIGVPDAILRKPGPLNDAEYDLIKKHPHTAIRILVHNSFLSEELHWILHHHERFDGTGYPDGLAGEGIPLGARILAVADAIDAMRSDRNYRRGSDVAQIRDELRRGAGGQFDPAVVGVALDCVVNDVELAADSATSHSPAPAAQALSI